MAAWLPSALCVCDVRGMGGWRACGGLCVCSMWYGAWTTYGFISSFYEIYMPLRLSKAEYQRARPESSAHYSFEYRPICFLGSERFILR